MSQKQAKRIRRMQDEIDLSHNCYWKLVTRLSRLEEQLEVAPAKRLPCSPDPVTPKPSLWQRIRMLLGLE